MTVTFRKYNHELDYERINQFLVRTYQKGGKYTNWLQPRWEYMIYHPGTEMDLLKHLGVWEDHGEIVALVNFEDSFGEAFFHYDSNYPYLKEEMFAFAENNLAKLDKKEYSLVVHIPEMDQDMIDIALSKGYQKDEEGLAYQTISRFDFSSSEDIKLPDGFKLQSLATSNDIKKYHRILWRGFNHEGEAPEEGIADRERMQAAPKYRKDLNMVVVAPDGNYVALAGMFYDEVNHVGYIEPVATDPLYRRMGLGKAAVLESIRRTKEKGAEEVFVESAIDFYLNIGFKKSFYRNQWIKKWSIK